MTQTAEPAIYEGLKVLLVDDNLTNRMIASKLFEQKHGFTPNIAINGLEAIKSLSDNHYDLIFMDCMMPEMDGYDACRAIRNGEAGQTKINIPVIALTANAMTGDRDDCMEAGMSDYLAKPIDPIQIATILEKWVGKKHEDWAEDATEDSQASENGPRVLDLERLKLICGDDSDGIMEMLEIFKDSTSETIGELVNAVKVEKDREKIRFFAHRIQGSSSEFGAYQLSEITADMEQKCLSGDVDAAIARLPEAQKAAINLIKEIQSLDLSNA